MASKTLKQTRTFNATPKDLYELLTDSKKHSTLTGAPAKISARSGGKFSAYGGELEGDILELKPNKKIVQTWRSSDWPEGHYSQAIFAFAPVGKNKTKMMFTQTDIPDGHFEDIKQGWITFYWEPMAQMFRK